MNGGDEKLEAILEEYRLCTRSANGSLEKAIAEIKDGKNILAADFFLNACGYWLVMANKAIMPLMKVNTLSPIGLKKHIDESKGAK